MSGHSKWAQIKHQKAGNDARRGQLFTKLGREITIAAREGGPDPEANVRLRLAIQRARDANMPSENIERAIKRATGPVDGAELEEAIYEGYGPGGAALLVQVATDNRNRTAAEVRNAFTRGGGSLGESGCVAWLFETRGVIEVRTDGQDPDEVALIAIDAGAEDVQTEGDVISIFTAPSDVERVREALVQRNIPVSSAETTLVPKVTLSTDDETALKVMRLIDRLEELDDVQKVYTNLEIPDSVLEQYAK
ncbi:MAG: YebC/PmpR family DNA-binding transcriptional regulator [Chloroflexi bacterium]|nr:YebC/PmpR family DNA-binding transcriptional regulator [Chloroflexota bacterium]HLG52039.1 YebC/PmpR family DNA-binding transcriptional regulator [Chloroflexota bacterium]